MESGSPSRGLSVPRLRISKGLQETPGKLGVWIGLSKRYTRCRRLSSSAQNWPRPSRCPGLRVLTLEPSPVSPSPRGASCTSGAAPTPAVRSVREAGPALRGRPDALQPTRVRGAAGVHGCGAGSRGAGRRGPRWRLAGAGARSVRGVRPGARPRPGHPAAVWSRCGPAGFRDAPPSCCPRDHP